MNTQKIICATIISIFLLFSNLISGQTPPPAPTGLRVTATECGKISLAWDDYGVGINETGYDIYRTFDNEGSAYYKLISLNADVTTYVDILSYQPSDRKIFYKVIGKNGTLESDFSAFVEASFTCDTPTNLLVTNTTCGSIDLGWDIQPNATSYEIYASTSENAYYNYYGTTSSNTNSYSFREYIARSGVLYFKIKGRFGNGNQSNFSNTAVSNTIVCPIVTGVKINSSSCGKISISWDDYPASVQETGFSISRSDSELGSYYSIGYVSANVTTFTDNSYLEPNKTYYYRVAGRFYNTTSFLSSFASGSFSCDIPTGLQIAATSCGEINVQWDDYPPELSESGFNIYRSESEAGPFYSIGSVNANVLTFADKSYSYYNSFLPDKIYYYKVAGRFENTTTQLSNLVSGSFSCTVPSGLKFTSSSCGSITLNWSDYPSGQSETGYRLYRSTDPNLNFYKIADINANVLTYSDNNLNEEGIIYHYKLKGQFNYTETEFSNLASSSFSCSVPTGLRVLSTSCGNINLSWDDFPQNVTENGYQIYISDSENGTYNQIGSVAANVLNYSVLNSGNYYNSGLNQNQIYYFKISGKFNNSNTHFSQSTSGSFVCPSTPNPILVNATCGSITISWPDFPSGVNEDGYEIYRSTSEFGSFSSIGSVAANVLSYTDNSYGLYENQTYYYKIKGKFSNSLTYISAPISANFTCSIPSTPIAVNLSCGLNQISWADYPAGTQETGFAIYRSDSENGYFSQIGTVAANVLVFEDKPNNYNNSYTYYYKIAGIFNNTFSNVSQKSNAVTFNCQALTSLLVSSTSCGSISLSWNDYPSGTEEDGFIIYRADAQNNYYYEIGQVNANITTFVDKNGYLNSGQTYYYKVVGKFNNLKGPESNIVSGSFTCLVPTGLQVTNVSCGVINISWTDYPNGTVETGYEIYRSTSESGTYVYIGSVSANVTNYFDNSYNLTSGATYYYKIKGRFNNSSSGLSSSIMASFNCPTPINLTVASTSCGIINLTWDNLPQSADFSEYVIYKSTSANGTFDYLSTVLKGYNTYSDMNFNSGGTTYYYKIKTKKNGGFSEFGNLVSASFTCPIPTNLAISATSCGIITLSWSDFPAPTSEIGYVIYRSLTQNGTYDQIGSVGANVLSYTDNYYLSQNKTYYYKIAARFNNSISQLGDFIAGSFICPIPQGLQISNTTCGKITLNWQDFTSPIQEIGYYIYRSTGGEYGEYQNIGSVNADITSYTDQYYLNPNTTYFYRIAARFSNTTTNYSNFVSSSFSCPIPTNLKIVSTSCGSINLSWDDLPNPILETSYQIYRSNYENDYYQQIDNLFANTTNYTDNGSDIIPNKIYYYKVKGVINNVTTNFSNIAYSSFSCNTCTSIKSGSWHDPTTWSCGRVPNSLDNVIINIGHLVTLDNNIIGNAKSLENNGNISFGNGSNLILFSQ